jgi:S1-C subfamily serine protease
VCLVILGSFQDSDQLNAAIYDSQGRVAWSTGPGTAKAQFGSGVSQDTGLVYTGLQYGLAITSSWPDGQYRATVNLNGPVVQTFTWAVGTVAPPNTPVPTPIIVGATNTPTSVPPTSTISTAPTNTPPPTATGAPHATATNTPRPTPSASEATATPGVTDTSCTGSVPNVVRCAKRSVLLVAGQIKGDRYSLGSGFVVRSDATGTYLVTNLHVVYGTRNVVVDDPYSRHIYKAEVVATNKAALGSAGDLAVIRIASTRLTVLQWGDSDALEEGDTVISIGYPGRDVFNIYDTPTITDGIVSALHRDEQDGYGKVWIQHQSIINHGNSGGPLLDLNGRVVGVNTLGISELPSVTGKGTEPVQGIFYAIPSNLARTIADKLIAHILAGTIPPAPAPPVSNPSTTIYKAGAYRISLPGDWSIKKSKDGSTVYLSSDQRIEIIPAVIQVPQAPSEEAEKKVVLHIAGDFGKYVKGQPSIAYQPASIGPLDGVSGLITASGTGETLTVYVVGDARHVLLVEVDAVASATTQDGDQAASSVASIRLS